MKKTILVIIFGFSVVTSVTSSGWVNHDLVPIANCSSDQLQIYQVAVDYPGMSQSHSLYGIINTAKTPCILPGDIPTVWEVAKDGRMRLAAISSEIPSSRNANFNGDFNSNYNDLTINRQNNAQTIDRDKIKSQPGELVIESSYQQNQIPGEKLVWFAVDGSEACWSSDKDYFPGFVKNKMIAIKLPEVINNKVFFVGYSGDAECGLHGVTKLQKNILHWDVLNSDDCSPSIKRVHGKLKIGDIFFKKIMKCG